MGKDSEALIATSNNVKNQIAFRGELPTSLELLSIFVGLRCGVINDASSKLEKIATQQTNNETSKLVVRPEFGNADHTDQETFEVLKQVRKHIKDKDIKDANLGKPRVDVSNLKIKFTASQSAEPSRDEFQLAV